MVNWSWMSNSQYLAQVGHFLGGTLFVVLAGTFWGPGYPLEIVLAGVVMASLKEFAFDLMPSPYGEGDSFQDSLQDWTYYILGALVGSGLFELAVYLHRYAT